MTDQAKDIRMLGWTGLAVAVMFPVMVWGILVPVKAPGTFLAFVFGALCGALALTSCMVLRKARLA